MKEEKQKVHAMMIFEIIGRPPQHIVNSLNAIIDQMNSEQGISVKNKEIKEPKKVEESSGIAGSTKEGFKIKESEFYLTFADVELEADDLFTLSKIIFKYMPAHVEVTSPENIVVSNGEWSDLLSELVQKLHAYDEVARVMQIEKSALESQLRNLLESNNKNSKKPVKKESKKTKKETKKK